MIIPRDRYLEKLSQRKQNGMIKVVTGMRRAGKSFLLMKLFHKRLVADGVPEDHILEVSLDDRRNHALRDPDAMLDWISKQMMDKQVSKIKVNKSLFMLEDQTPSKKKKSLQKKSFSQNVITYYKRFE